MQELRMFSGFFMEAIRMSYKRSLPILFSVLFSVFSIEYATLILGEGGPFEDWSGPAASFFTLHPITFLLIPILAIWLVSTKLALILALSENGTGLKRILRDTVRKLPAAITLEIAAVALSLLVIGLLMLPFGIAHGSVPHLASTFAIVGISISVPILTTIVFTEIFGFFYIALAGTPIRTSIELGYSLFVKHIATSIFFGLFTMLLTMIFSMIVTTVMFIFDSPESTGVEEKILISFSLLAVQSFIVLVQKSAWISFFHFIAKKDSSERETSQEEESVIQREVHEIG